MTGSYSAAEIKNAPAAILTLDKNHDDQVTPDELRPQMEGRGADGRGAAGRGEGRGRANNGPEAGSPDDMVTTLMAFDKNKDGKLSKTELPERMQGLFDRADTNHDGFLTSDEIRKLAAAQAPPDDGPEERGRGEGRGEGRGGQRPPDPLMNALDLNHDGTLSASEIAVASASLMTLDKNSDGQLTDDEYRVNFGRGGRGRGNEPPM